MGEVIFSPFLFNCNKMDGEGHPAPGEGTMTDKQHVVDLLDRLGLGQVAAVVHLLEAMVLPDAPSPETTSPDMASLDEDRDTLSPAEAKAIAEADE